MISTAHNNTEAPAFDILWGGPGKDFCHKAASDWLHFVPDNLTNFPSLLQLKPQ